MIPLTHEVKRGRCSRRIRIATGRCARLVLACVLCVNIPASAFALTALQQSQDSTAKPAPIPATQQPAGSPNSPTHAASESAPPKKTVHQKKVITEDDLAKPAE